MYRNLVDQSQVNEDVDHEAGMAEGMEEQHVSEATISEGRTQYRDVVLVSPVIY